VPRRRTTGFGVRFAKLAEKGVSPVTPSQPKPARQTEAVAGPVATLVEAALLTPSKARLTRDPFGAPPFCPTQVCAGALSAGQQ
jgi:hypothetical protein